MSNDWGYQESFKPVFLVLAVLIQYDAKDFQLLVWRKIIVFVLSCLGNIHTLSVMFILLEAALLEDQTFCVRACVLWAHQKKGQGLSKLCSS